MDVEDWAILLLLGSFTAGIAGYFLGVWGALTAFSGIVLISLFFELTPVKKR